MRGPDEGPWRVGELAKRTGVTVRTLHHYDEIGVLVPSHHTDSGHRLYTRRDLARLQEVLALRQIGYSLEQTAAALAAPNASPLDTLRRLREDVLRRRSELEQLDTRLEEVERIMAQGGEVSTARMIEIIGRLVMFEKYLTKEQLAAVAATGAALGPERLQQASQVEWPALIVAVRAELQAGTDPAEPRVVALARQWMALVAQFTGGDPQIARGVRTMYESEPAALATLKARGSPADDMPALMAYVERALKG